MELACSAPFLRTAHCGKKPKQGEKNDRDPHSNETELEEGSGQKREEGRAGAGSETTNVMVPTSDDLGEHGDTNPAQRQERHKSYEALLREKFKVEVVGPGCDARIGYDPRRELKRVQVRTVVQNITVGAVTEKWSIVKHGQRRRPKRKPAMTMPIVHGLVDEAESEDGVYDECDRHDAAKQKQREVFAVTKLFAADQCREANDRNNQRQESCTALNKDDDDDQRREKAKHDKQDQPTRPERSHRQGQGGEDCDHRNVVLHD